MMPCIKKMGISSLPWSPIVSLRIREPWATARLITLRTPGRWFPRPTSHATTRHHLSWRKGDPPRTHRDRRQRGYQERSRPTWNHHGPSGHRVDPGQPGRRRAHRWHFEREEFGRCCQGFGRRLVGRGQGEDRFGIHGPQDYRAFLSVPGPAARGTLVADCMIRIVSLNMLNGTNVSSSDRLDTRQSNSRR